MIESRKILFKIHSCTGKIQIQSNDEFVIYEVLEIPNDGVIQPFICGNDIPETARCSMDNFTSEPQFPSDSVISEPAMPSDSDIISKSFDYLPENETLDIKPSKRIIGGTIKKTNKFPWVVEMVFTNENRESFVCGAAIYSSTVLITGNSYTLTRKLKKNRLRFTYGLCDMACFKQAACA